MSFSAFCNFPREKNSCRQKDVYKRQVFYKPLSKTEIFRIVDLLLEKLRKRLEDKQLELEVTDAAKECIVAQGYDVNYGARPLKRLIQSKVETLVARKIIADDPAPGTVIRICLLYTSYFLHSVFVALFLSYGNTAQSLCIRCVVRFFGRLLRAI